MEEIWTNSQGEQIPISQMTIGHLTNTLAFLERTARQALKRLNKDENEWEKVVCDKYWPLKAEFSRRLIKKKVSSKQSLPSRIWSFLARK